MQNVLVCSNASKPEVVAAAYAMLDSLCVLGFRPILSECTDTQTHIFDKSKVRVLPNEEALKSADFMLVFGGDGTMLHFANEAAAAKLPMLGVNMGKLGFMTELEPSEVCLMSNILKGDYIIDRRMMLDVAVVRNGEVVYEDAALNDAVITKGEIMRVIDVSVFSDGEHLVNYTCDGVIVCTPTGSTAYSMAAGGPIVEPTSENITITHICAHALYARALVLSPERTVTLKTGHLDKKSAYLSVDGGDNFRLTEEDAVLVLRSKLESKLLRIHSRSFYEVLSKKLSDRK